MMFPRGKQKRKNVMTMPIRNKYLLIDTETCNSLECPLQYNFAGAIIDQHGEVYERGSFLNMDVFAGERELMQTAYYADKIPQYVEQLREGSIVPSDSYLIRRWVREMCEKWDVKAIIAHNMRFDYRSCTTTQRYMTKSKCRFFFPKGIPLWDTMKMAQDVIVPKPTYRQFCKDNGFICKNGQVRKTAEVLYRYITQNEEFVEEHKAMEDVDIECQIFWYCMRQHKAMRRNAFGEG